MNFAVSEQNFTRLIRTQTRSGRAVCIKYALPLSRKAGVRDFLKRAVLRMLPEPFSQSVAQRSIIENNRLEIAKLRAFKAARFEIPEILIVQQKFSVFIDPGENLAAIADKLRVHSADLHDELLIRCAENLGQIHARGMCCGRPALEDMFLGRAEIGFWSFREYPEHSMTIAEAQARDMYFLLLALTKVAVHKDYVLRAAFKLWRRQVGLETLDALRANLQHFRPFFGVYRFFAQLRRDKDKNSALQVLQFLLANAGI